MLREQLTRLGGIDPGPVVVEAAPSSLDGLGWRTRVQVSVGTRRVAGAAAPPIACRRARPALPDHAPADRCGGGVARRRPRGSSGGASAAAAGRVRGVTDLRRGGDRRRRHARPPCARTTISGSPAAVSGRYIPTRRSCWRMRCWRRWRRQPGERALDLYAGAGLFSYALASRGVAVTAVEVVASAAVDARVNCEGLEVTVHAADVGEALGSSRPALRSTSSCSTRRAPVPARTSCGSSPRPVRGRSPTSRATARRWPATSAPPPRRGYRLERLRAFDLFPMTAHLECLALLAPGPADQP